MNVTKLGFGLKTLLKTTNTQSIYIIGVMNARNISTMEITKNISLISEDKLNAKLVKFELHPPQNKPLVIMPNWLLAKKKHVYKYSQLYTKRGFDVLNISLTPWQLLWPSKGAQLVASDILKFLDNNFTNSPLLVHGFSVGAYLWGEVLVKMAAELPKYNPMIDRFAGQIWDSAVDITEIPIGFPMAVFPRNPVMQATFRKYIMYHLKTFERVATRHYVRSSQMFHTNIIRAPALFFTSEIDPIGAVPANMRVRENWESLGMQIIWKCWSDSNHVGHLAKYPEEYKELLNMFMDKALVHLQSDKMQAEL